MDTVENLAAKAQEGCRESLGKLFVMFAPTIERIIEKRLGNKDDAQEICHDVFIHVMKKIHQLRETAAFAGWICRIANRMAINKGVRRKPTVRLTPKVMGGMIAVEETTPLDITLEKEQQRVRSLAFHKGMNALCKLDREALIAFHMKEQSLLEISADLQTPVGTIKRRLHVARKRLKEQCHKEMSHV